MYVQSQWTFTSSTKPAEALRPFLKVFIYSELFEASFFHGNDLLRLWLFQYCRRPLHILLLHSLYYPVDELSYLPLPVAIAAWLLQLRISQSEVRICRYSIPISPPYQSHQLAHQLPHSLRLRIHLRC